MLSLSPFFKMTTTTTTKKKPEKQETQETTTTKNPHKTKSQNRQKTNKQKQNIHKTSTGLVLCWSTAPGHGACSEVWFIYSVRFLWEKLFSLYQWVSVADNFPVRAGTHYPLHPLWARITYDLNLYRSYACCQSLGVHIYGPCCVLKTLFPWTPLLALVLTVFLPPLESWGEDSIPSRTQCFSPSLSAHGPVVVSVLIPIDRQKKHH